MDLFITYFGVILIAFIASTMRGDRKNITLKTLILSFIGIIFVTAIHFIR